jgi:hypothetical protein
MTSIGPASRREKKSKTGVPVPEIPTAEEVVEILSGPPVDNLGADGVIKPEYEFELDFKCVRGRMWSGRFKCHVLTIRERAQVGLIRSRMATGMSPLSMDGSTIDLLEMQAHLAVALDDAPDWAGDLGGLHDPSVLGAIYKEVASHEARFWGSAIGEDSGDVDE